MVLDFMLGINSFIYDVIGEVDLGDYLFDEFNDISNESLSQYFVQEVFFMMVVFIQQVLILLLVVVVLLNFFLVIKEDLDDECV